MTGHLRHYRAADRRGVIGLQTPDVSTVVAQCWLANRFRREFVVRRVSAYISEAEIAGWEEEQAPTEGGPDKRPHIAARLGGCFCFYFLLIRQCAASARTVRVTLNLLPRLLFSHIAEVSHG